MRTISQRIVLAVAATATVVGSVAATAGPASARKYDCRPNNMCTWVDGGFAGSNYVPYPWEVNSGTSYANAPSNYHDDGSSWWNNTSRIYCVYDHVSGRRVTLDRLYAATARGVVPSGTNDRIDAVGWC